MTTIEQSATVEQTTSGPVAAGNGAQAMADAVAAEKAGAQGAAAAKQKQDLGFEATLDGSDLTITGSDGDDTISVTRQPDGKLRVQSKGHAGHYDIPSAVKTVTIDAKDGTNSVTIDEKIKLPFTLTGGTGANIFSGGAGNDTLTGYGFYNNLSGGDGNDIINGGGVQNPDPGDFMASTPNILNGGSGNDTIVGARFAVNIIRGDEGDDHLIGGNERDRITGGPGNDDLSGGDGDDLLLMGGPGEDKIDGGAGNDALYIHKKDFVVRGVGNDKEEPDPTDPAE